MALRFLTILFFLIPVLSVAQKNVTDVTKSGLTGIDLPAGSKQDKRILSSAAAETLLEMKAEEIGRSVSGNVEVLLLPVASSGGGSGTVKQLLLASGYKVTEVQGDVNYSVLEKEAKSWLIYLDDSKTTTDFYSIPLAEKQAVTSVAAVTPVVSGASSDPAPAPAPAVVVAAPAASISTLPAEQPKPPVQSPPLENKKEEPAKSVVPESPSGFKYTTTNFNDGWVGSITDNYVLLTKDKINVRLYYAYEITDQIRSYEGDVHGYFWNELVVPSFNIIQAWKWEESVTYFRTYYIWAEAVDRSTGKNCYIGLNVAVNNGIASPVLAIADNKQDYDSMFPKPENVKNMLGYNKFAVALQDLPGTWTELGGATANYYNSYTGAYAGMGFTSSADSFTFFQSGEYSSKHTGAFGMVGNMQTYNQEYKGKATVTDWEIVLPNRWKGQTDTFEAWFEVVRGGRILRLINKNASGITYDLVRISK